MSAILLLLHACPCSWLLCWFQLGVYAALLVHLAVVRDGVHRYGVEGGCQGLA